ncbi:MAG: hypothetical protein IJT58_05445 [Synergistaceae bacterium]|nr:hypothetical protein [Synergistaceae bacterium]
MSEGGHWFYCGDSDEYDDIHDVVSLVRGCHIIRTMGTSLGMAWLLRDYRCKKCEYTGKSYPEAREYAERWNSQVKKGERIDPEEAEVMAGIIEECTCKGDVVVAYSDITVQTLIACEVTGRVCLVMKATPEECERVKKQWIVITE